MKTSTALHHKTYVEIDAATLRANLRALISVIGPARNLVLVVKSDAYGHGASTVAAIAGEEGVRHFAVVSVDDGALLRRGDLTSEILLLHPPFEYDFPAALESHLSPVITSEELARLYSRLAGGQTLGVHVEINTGLSRLGLNWETAAETISHVAGLPNLKINGLYTHYRSHYSPAGDSIHEQTQRFERVVAELQKRGIDPGFRHAASSYPLAYHPSTVFDGIRVGIIAYGAMDTPPAPLSGIQPVMSVRSCVMHTRSIRAGEWVHYGDGFHADRDMQIAVIPIGYGMGYPRHLSNNGDMLIHGKRCPIVGVIGMDMTMVDVSALPAVNVGDPVTVMGTDGNDTITAIELAKRVGTIAYEITCRLGNGLPRYVAAETSAQTKTAKSSVAQA